MNRREFISKTSAGITALCIAPGLWSCNNVRGQIKDYSFRSYRLGKTMGEIQIVTPEDGFYCNTYYDVCPWSPSQKYLAVTKLPYQDQITVLGDIAEVCIIDLKQQSIRTVYKTKVWGYQLGANLHWGDSDRYLYTNDLIDGQHAVCVRIDLETGETTAYQGPKYDLDSQRKRVIGPPLEYLNTTQYAYGTPAQKADPVSFMKLPPGAAKNEGLWQTDLNNNEERLLVTLHEAANVLGEQDLYEGGTFYFFHTKYNPQADKMLLVIRCVFPDTDEFSDRGGNNPTLLIADGDGKNLAVSISRKQWRLGGHHPTWHPDGEHIIMNLTPEWLGEDRLRFCQFKPDGSDFKILSKKFLGSGHPTITPNSRFLLTDAYPMNENFALENGEVPIRLIDLQEEKEHTICNVFIDMGQKYDIRRSWGPTKLDVHPVWNKDFKKVCFNGAPEGKRAVLIADLANTI